MQDGNFMKLFLILLFYSFQSMAVFGPLPKPEKEIFHSIIENLDKINVAKEIYIEPFRGIDSKWMERFGIPFAMKMGRFFYLEHSLVNFNLVGFYKIPFGYPLREYALKAQLSIPLP